jgi:hypothetical protein
MVTRLPSLRGIPVAAVLTVVCIGLYVHTQIITSDWLFHVTFIAAFIATLICGYYLARQFQPGTERHVSVFAILTVMGALTCALMGFVFPACQLVRNANVSRELFNNMSQIGEAMRRYADEHNGRLPAPAIYGKDGQLLLSWRVALLPYLGHDDLYRQFKLDEPWDSPHNLSLAAHMPKVYAVPLALADDEPPNSTRFQVFAGRGTAFEGKAGVSLLDFPDGRSNTLLFAVAHEPVMWTKPADMSFTPQGSVPKLLSLRLGESTSHAAVNADFSWQSLPTSIAVEDLRALITRNGGEPPPKN